MEKSVKNVLIISNVLDHCLKKVCSDGWRFALLYASRFGVLYGILFSIALILWGLFYLLPINAAGGMLGTMFFLMFAIAMVAGTVISIKKAMLAIDAGLSVTWFDFDLISSLTWSYCVAVFLFWLMVCGGYLLLIIPGFIIYVRFILFPYYMIDQRLKVFASLCASYKSTSGYTVKLLGLLLIAWIVPGIMLFFIHACLWGILLLNYSSLVLDIVNGLLLILLLYVYCMMTFFQNFLLVHIYRLLSVEKSHDTVTTII